MQSSIPVILVSLLALAACAPTEGPVLDEDDDGGWSGGGSEGGGDDGADDGGDDGGTDGGDDGGTDGGGSSGSTGDDGVEICSEPDQIWPLRDASNVSWRDPVQVWLGWDDPSLSLVLLDHTGAEVAGALSEVTHGVYRYSPDLPLTPEAYYTVVMVWCDGVMDADWSFRVTAHGAPLEVDLSDRTWAVRALEGWWPGPVGAMVPILESFGEIRLLLGVTDYNLGEITFTGAGETKSGGAQDLEVPTQDFGTWTFPESPSFEVGPISATVPTDDFDVELEDLTLRGTFAADARTIGGLRLEATLDLRHNPALAEYVGIEDPDETCEMLMGFGVSCEPCTDGEAYCLPMDAWAVPAPEVPGLSLVRVE